MLQTVYEACLDRIRRMHRECPQWADHAASCIADYLAGEFYQEQKALTFVGEKVYRRLLRCDRERPLTREDCIDVTVELREAGEKVYASAYLFAIRLFSDLLGIPCEVPIDALGDEFIRYEAGKAAGEGEEDPDRARLRRYQNRLLDYSRGNPLVHFKPLRSVLKIASPSVDRLLTALETEESIAFEPWSSLGAAQILECEDCGLQFVRKYDKKTATHAQECPVCDFKKRTKRAKPLSESPLFLSSSDPLRLACPDCGTECAVTEVPSEIPSCMSCGAKLRFPSSPVIGADALGGKGTAFCVSSVGDEATVKAADAMNKYASRLRLNFGLHSLYAACGFLRWTARTGQEYLSPILLCRVGIAVDKTKGKAILSADASGEETVFLNHTLKKMLENYSDNLSVRLPEYEGQPFADYAIELRSAFRGLPECDGWKIEETAAVGRFYYHKLQLEKDLSDHFETYFAHPVVRKLCEIEDPESERSEDSTEAGRGFCVLDADSSQQSVIETARSGRSFVLQGPPGTGKSRTISNLIADAIGRGRTVLFVTEKATARSIIHENLAKITVDGTRRLTDYVLNLEEMNAKGKAGQVNKTDLRNFYNEHFAVSEVPVTVGGEEGGAAEEDRLREFYTAALARDAQGTSLFGLIGSWSRYAEAPAVDLSGTEVGTVRLAELLIAVRDYYAGAKALGPAYTDYRTAPLYGYTERNLLTPNVQGIDRLRGLLNEVSALSETVRPMIGEDLREVSCGALGETAEQIEAFAYFPQIAAEILSDERAELPRHRAAEFLRLAKEYAENRRTARETLERLRFYHYEETVHTERLLALDLASMWTRLQSFASPFSRLGGEYRRFKGEILAVLKTPPRTVHYADLRELLFTLDGCLTAYNKRRAYESGYDTDRIRFRSRARGYETDWEALIFELDKALSILSDLRGPQTDRLLAYLVSAVGTGNAYAFPMRRAAEDLASLAAGIERECSELDGVFDRATVSLREMPVRALLAYLDGIVADRSLLPAWARLQAILTAEDARAAEILHALLDAGIFTAEDAEAAVSRAHYQMRICTRVAETPALFAFYSWESAEDAIAAYRTADEIDLADTARRLYARLTEEKNRVCLETLGTRRKKLITKYKGIPIKTILKEQWEQIRAVTPCVMMSPLDVSRYLDLSVHFDTVIFDEASQIYLEEALASVVRGDQIIISGDEQQLPPFDFGRASEGYGEEWSLQDEEEADGDGVSVLGGALRSSLDAVALKWHYRSREETLIDFSNRRFYGGGLVTFPSAARNEQYGVFLDYVKDGRYLSASQRINREEADRVVELLYEEMTSEERKGNSLGVVAFSKAQADEIEDRFLAFVAGCKDPRVREWMDAEEHKREPIIFCNLDTVQGDERDTVIVSTTYGYTPDGRFQLSFLGPIRTANGRKRINVAVTRARCRMTVVTSLQSADLDRAIRASQGTNEGAAVLRDFIAYAETFGGGQRVCGGGQSSEFLQSVCRVLDRAGICYDVNVGLSACRVHIGIKRAPEDGDYVLGILTDEEGLTKQSVRDFARLRDRVLTEKYAWNLYHVRMLPWFADYGRECERLLTAVKDSLSGAAHASKAAAGPKMPAP